MKQVEALAEAAQRRGESRSHAGYRPVSRLPIQETITLDDFAKSIRARRRLKCRVCGRPDKLPRLTLIWAARSVTSSGIRSAYTRPAGADWPPDGTSPTSRRAQNALGVSGGMVMAAGPAGKISFLLSP